SLAFPSDYASGNATLLGTCVGSNDTVTSTQLTFAASPSTTVTTGANPTVTGQWNLGGACGSSMGSGTANVNIAQGSTNASLGTVNLSNVGSFTQSVFLPSSITPGNATVTVTCSNGRSFSSNVYIGSAAVTGLNSGTPVANRTSTVSGRCENNSGGGNVRIGLVRDGQVQNLLVNNAMLETGGYFTALVSFPPSESTSTMNMLVTCPTGSTFTAPITLTAATADVDTTDPDCCVGGTDEDTPQGGVEAGRVGDPSATIITLLVIMAVAGMYYAVSSYYARK
ncbi:MAG TPA: hypothetical protein VEA59_06505, partial [Patescibacteria group bacterium]|nr:hypothetical protein [Patescibacteria group bacterium]